MLRALYCRITAILFVILPLGRAYPAFLAQESTRTSVLKGISKWYEEEGERQGLLRVSSHTYLSTGLGFGQSRSTGEGHPKTAWGLNVSVGVLKTIDYYSAIDARLQSTLWGRIGHSKADLKLKWSPEISLAYGYSLIPELWVFLRMGAGITFAEYSGLIDREHFTSSHDLLGNILKGGMYFYLPLTEDYSLESGFEWNNYSFTLNSVTNSKGEEKDVDQVIQLNVPEISLSLRYAL